MSTLAEFTIAERRTIRAKAYLATTTALTKGLLIVIIFMYVPATVPILWDGFQLSGLAIPIFGCGFLAVLAICSIILKRGWNIPDLHHTARHLWAYVGIMAFGASLLHSRDHTLVSLMIFFQFVTMLNIFGLIKSFNPRAFAFPLMLSVLSVFTIMFPVASLLGHSIRFYLRAMLYTSALVMSIFNSIDIALHKDRVLNEDAPIRASIYPIVRPVEYLRSFF
jgi:hypothetical protein